MPGRDVVESVPGRVEHGEEERDELPGRRVAEQVAVEPVEGGDRVEGLVDDQVEPGREGRHEQRGGDPLARHVGECHGEAAAGEREPVVVVAADDARRAGAAEDLEPRHVGELGREDLALDRRGDLDLPLDPLLLDRLAVEPRVLEGDGGLRREHGQRPQVVRLEGADRAAAALLLGDGEDADPAILGPHRHGEHRDPGARGGGEPRRERRPVGGIEEERLAGGDLPNHLRGEERSAEVAAERRAAVDREQVEAPAPGVDEGEPPQQQLLGERLGVEVSGDGEADVVEALELPEPVAELEIGFLDPPGQQVAAQQAGQVAGDDLDVGRLDLVGDPAAAGAEREEADEPPRQSQRVELDEPRGGERLPAGGREQLLTVRLAARRGRGRRELGGSPSPWPAASERTVPVVPASQSPPARAGSSGGSRRGPARRNPAPPRRRAAEGASG